MIITRIPVRPKPPIRPALDQIICQYLHENHSVDIRPVASDISPSRATNAVMGAMGAEYVVANTHITQQQKAAALQEWTSWKQFALQQPDFIEFKAAALSRHELEVNKYQQNLAEYERLMETPEVKALVEAADKQERGLKIIIGCLLAAFVSISLVSIISQESRRQNDDQSFLPITPGIQFQTPHPQRPA